MEKLAVRRNYIKRTIKEIVNFSLKKNTTTGFFGNIKYDPSKPDGAPRKLLDVTRLTKMGWTAEINLDQGLEETFNWFKDNRNNIRQ